jgi:hypothetical protein
MSFSRRLALPLSVVALSISIAGPALASTGGPAGIIRLDPVPSDCTVRGILPATMIMTCNNRPANQQWRSGADCYDWTTGGYDFKYGSIATGNGSSNITGCYPRQNIGFFPLS